ncbi:VOC family protein [Mucilaginibacter dorajii]|nr:VOC family protein [Mucilaginibacter dorajii]MCS3732799.1 putative enzyme related to lactoylglutathione lyase [Mucilaginibacter dorajii]
MKIKLIVIRTSDMPRLVGFYQLLGLTFDYHKHGASPYHFSAEVEELIFEIYPLAKGQTDTDKYLRLGFEIADFDETIATLKDSNVLLASEPVFTEFGFMAVVIDPDGRKVELYKSKDK